MKVNENLIVGDSNKTLNDLVNILPFFNMFNFETKEQYGAKWLKIYYTNSKSGSVLWDNLGELGFSFQNYKWSILGLIDNLYNSTYGGFEFLLEYPSIGTHNRWRQTSNPLRTKQSVTGYSAVDVQITSNGWGGLSRSSDSSTFIDGSPTETTWYYAIGQRAVYKNGIPSGNETAVQEVYLWLRIG